jgi:hypothetical protein
MPGGMSPGGIEIYFPIGRMPARDDSPSRIDVRFRMDEERLWPGMPDQWHDSQRKTAQSQTYSVRMIAARGFFGDAVFER